MNIAGICWKSFISNNPNHVNNLNDMGFKFLRIFINLADFPQEQVNQSYINKIMKLPDGKWAWDNYSQRWWSSPINERVHHAFDFCKKNNWIPVVCFGHSEEQSSWLTRSPGQDKWTWLRLLTTEFAEYLRNVYGFYRADIECWNEPNECMTPEVYSNVALNMFIGWKSVSSNYMTHAFASNIGQQVYLDHLLGNAHLMQYTDYISPHCISDKEWDSNLIEVTYQKCLSKGKKVSLLEISPLGKMDRMKSIIGKCDMYALVLIIRNSLIGQNDGIIIDDFLIYDFNDPDKFIAITTWKMKWIKDFNLKYFNSNIGDEIMLEEYGKSTVKKEAVKFIQKALNLEIYTSPQLIVDGWFGTNTEAAVKKFQVHNGLPQTGIVKKAEMKILAKNHPNEWIEFSVGIHYGDK